MKQIAILIVMSCCFVTSVAQQKQEVPNFTAKELYEKACDYLNGENGELIDSLKAIELFEKSANLGYAPAQCEVAMRSDDEDVALTLLQKAIDQNYNYAYYLIYLTYRNGHKNRDTKKAISYLQKGAELGDVTCQWLMGDAYYFGRDNLTPNGKLAIFWLKKAATQDQEIAMGLLASIYDEGKYIERDINKANELYKRAAELGNPEAAYNYAYAYIVGDGVEINKETAFIWMKKAAELGYIQARLELAYMFATGKGCEKNSEAARYWWGLVAKDEKASGQDRKGAEYNISLLDQHIEIE